MHFLRYLSLLILLVLAACSSTEPLTDSSADSSNASVTSEVTVNTEVEAIPESPTTDWHLLSAATTPFPGTEVERAYREFLSDREVGRKVVVAIIDSGTDIDHEDLKDNIWINRDEIAGNDLDDDANGYVDDLYGWNFIGGSDGRHVEYDTYEVTRIYASLEPRFGEMEPDSVPEALMDEYEYYVDIKQAYQEEKMNAQQNLMQLKNILQAIQGSKQLLGVTHLDSLSTDDLKPVATDGPYQQQAKQIAARLIDLDITEEDIQRGVDQYAGIVEYGVDPDFDPRHIVGDDYDDLTDRYYGNSDVSGLHNEHGTHVAGIVGAVRKNALGVDGIAPVELMILRTVPNGDERDKDVANAIRYAAENGAHVINMSFGKGYSPQKAYVDAAVRFADSLGVLMVHGAGNDGANIDSVMNFPSKYYLNGGEATHFLTVGASSWQQNESLSAGFSNYGRTTVDLFAPGVEIYSTYPSDTYKAEDGTSMASPVVAGVAALLMSYYPELTTGQVKDILLRSVTVPDDVYVQQPGGSDLVPFSELSVTGGIVNAYQAVKLAEEMVKE